MCPRNSIVGELLFWLLVGTFSMLLVGPIVAKASGFDIVACGFAVGGLISSWVCYINVKEYWKRGV